MTLKLKSLMAENQLGKAVMAWTKIRKKLSIRSQKSVDFFSSFLQLSLNSLALL
jgi:hypothetical protein